MRGGCLSAGDVLEGTARIFLAISRLGRFGLVVVILHFSVSHENGMRVGESRRTRHRTPLGASTVVEDSNREGTYVKETMGKHVCFSLFCSHQ